MKTVQLNCTHKFEQSGASDVPLDLLAKLRPPGTIRPQMPWQTAERRSVIAILWSGSAAIQESLDAHLERDFRLPAASIDDLPKRLPAPIDPRIRRLVNWSAAIHLRRSTTRRASGGWPVPPWACGKRTLLTCVRPKLDIVDLRQTDFAEIMAPIVNQLATGNSKSSELLVIELDPSNGRVDIGFTLHHRHIWPTTREALTRLQSGGVPVEAEFADLIERRVGHNISGRSQSLSRRRGKGGRGRRQASRCRPPARYCRRTACEQAT